MIEIHDLETCLALFLFCFLLFPTLDTCDKPPTSKVPKYEAVKYISIVNVFLRECIFSPNDLVSYCCIMSNEITPRHLCDKVPGWTFAYVQR